MGGDAGTSTPEPAVAADPPGAGHGGDTAFNPCSDLNTELVGRLLGSPVTEDLGTPGDPRCAYLPTEQGAPAMEVNYLVYTGPLDEVFAQMGPTPGRARDLDLPTATDARLFVNATDEGIAVTGFVQTGGLVETVNTVALPPYDRATVVSGTRAVMRRLSAQAATRAAD